jgi:hypothetical protein
VSATGTVTGSSLLGSVVSVSANVTGGNILTGGLVSATGTVTGSSLLGSVVSASANITGGNILTGGLISATGNVTGANIVGVIRPTSGTGTNGIVFPANPGGGGGDLATIQYYAASGEDTVLELAVTNDATDIIKLNATGGVSIVGNTTGGNISVTGNITGNTNGYAIGYLNIPQVSLSANTTTAASDTGKHYYSTSAANLSLTIANNSSVSWAVGTTITIINQGTGTITVGQGSGVSLYFAGNSTAANRSLSTFGMATIINVASNTWFINGSGVY